MRRLIISIWMLFVLLAPCAAGASGMDIGVSTWLCWWQPSWNNEKEGFNVAPAFFYGPGLSFRLPANVTISSNFFYARIKAVASKSSFSATLSPSRSNRVICRYDSDTTISYSFTGFFRLFAGFKYSHYKISHEKIMLMSLFFIYGDFEKYCYNDYAPALGVGFTVHLIENFYLMINASLLYDYSSIYKSWYSCASPSYCFPSTEKSWFVHKIGGNAHLSFAYLIQPIDTVISIGFRYQFFKALRADSTYEEYSEYYDHFYGVTASVLYRIDFKKKQELRDELALSDWFY